MMNRAPTAEDHFGGGPDHDSRGYPVIKDAMDPCWSLWRAEWPGLTPDEAVEIVRKTRMNTTERPDKDSQPEVS